MREPDPVEEGLAHRLRLVDRRPAHVDRRLDDVLERGHVREEVEALEDHADLLALLRDVPLLVLDELAVGLAVADEVAVHEDPALLDLLEVVDAADERRLARSRRADDDDHFLALDGHRHAFEDVQPAEPLVDVGRLDDHVPGGCRDATDRGEQIVRRPAINGLP